MERRFRIRTRAVALALVLAGAALTIPGHQGAGRSAALTTFVGDFEVGAPGWQQFEGLQYDQDRPSAESFALVDNPVRQGRHAVRITSRHGYSMFGHNESTLLLYRGGEEEGDEFWYAWSTLFPRDWAEPYKWGIFAEWHANLHNAPLIGFVARGNRAELTLLTGLTEEGTSTATENRTVPLLATLSKGRWNDFVMRVRWSARGGLVEVFHRVAGTPSLRKLASFRNLPTFQWTKDGRGLGTYLLLGMYRGSYCPQPTVLGCTSSLGVQPPSTVFHDGFVRASTFEAAAARAFPGRAPTLPREGTRAVQQEGAPLETLKLSVAQSARARTAPGCKRCRVVSKGGLVVARIGNAHDNHDSAVLDYRLRQRTATVIRHRLRVVAQRLTGRLVVARLQDAGARTLAEVYVDRHGALRVFSPKGALRPGGVDVDTGVSAAPGAEPLSVELRLTRDELQLGVFGRLVARLDDLAGPRRGERLWASVGIDRYDGRRSDGAISVVFDELVVGSS